LGGREGGGRATHRVRLGVYSDLRYWSDGETLSTNRAFIRFVTSLPPRVDEVVLFGRLAREPGRAPYTLPHEGVRLVPLPWYPKVTDVTRLLRASRGSVRIFRNELDGLDAVWIFGPHPLALAFALAARRRGTPLFLGIRQDYPEYVGNRLSGKRWIWTLPLAHGLERSFRALGRSSPTVALGAEIAQHYERGEAPVLTTGFSLVRRSELTPPEQALARSWAGELQVLSVGRLDPEKNPLLLADVLAAVRSRDPRWRLVVAGEGPLRKALTGRLEELGLADAAELLGEVPNGPELWELYRRSHAFLHVSLTEGLPQVLFEAQAAGLPVVATAVGGVPAALHGGETGLLVPPNDAGAAGAALERLARDETLRRRLVAAGLRAAAGETMEAQLDAIAAFFRHELERGAYARLGAAVD
jgi:glycosyltransferase involved in cell wall biosynthesis